MKNWSLVTESKNFVPFMVMTLDALTACRATAAMSASVGRGVKRTISELFLFLSFSLRMRLSSCCAGWRLEKLSVEKNLLNKRPGSSSEEKDKRKDRNVIYVDVDVTVAINIDKKEELCFKMAL